MQKHIIYDSNCKFCSRFVLWAKNKNQALNAISVRDRNAKELLKSHGVRFINLQTIYYVDRNNVFVRSKAIFNICRQFNYPWKIIFYFSYLPVWMTDFFYKQFAKYRYYF